jgi:hypothetical protein
MWRWIGGIVAIAILALMGTCYAGYRRITSGGDTVDAMLSTSPAKTFSLLTDRDSLLAWLSAGTTIMPEHHGPVRGGDTIRVASPARAGASSGRAMQLWIVREVKAPDVFVIDALEFDPGGLAHAAFTRRDSISASGDSTRIVSTFEMAPMLPAAESAMTGGSDFKASLLNTAQRMRLGAARMMWQEQLRRIEHRDAP